MKLTLISPSLLAAMVISAAQAEEAEVPLFSIAPSKITQAGVMLSPTATRLQITVSPQKSAEFSHFTAQNIEKQVRIIIAGRLDQTLTVHDQIRSGTIDFPAKSPEEGLSLAKAFTSQ